MQRIVKGSEEAAWELVMHYGHVIRRAVRLKLNVRMRSKFDSLDFVQLVWLSFFRARDRVVRFTRPEELVAFLTKMARNKVGMEFRRRLQTEKYDVNRECSLDTSCAQHAAIPAHQPAGIDVAIARERWDRMLSNQPEGYRRIIRLRLRGLTNQEIADRLEIAECTVRRFLKRLLREHLE